MGSLYGWVRGKLFGQQELEHTANYGDSASWDARDHSGPHQQEYVALTSKDGGIKRAKLNGGDGPIKKPKKAFPESGMVGNAEPSYYGKSVGRRMIDDFEGDQYEVLHKRQRMPKEPEESPVEEKSLVVYDRMRYPRFQETALQESDTIQNMQHRIRDVEEVTARQSSTVQRQLDELAATCMRLSGENTVLKQEVEETKYQLRERQLAFQNLERRNQMRRAADIGHNAPDNTSKKWSPSPLPTKDQPQTPQATKERCEKGAPGKDTENLSQTVDRLQQMMRMHRMRICNRREPSMTRVLKVRKPVGKKAGFGSDFLVNVVDRPTAAAKAEESQDNATPCAATTDAATDQPALGDIAGMPQHGGHTFKENIPPASQPGQTQPPALFNVSSQAAPSVPASVTPAVAFDKPADAQATMGSGSAKPADTNTTAKIETVAPAAGDTLLVGAVVPKTGAPTFTFGAAPTTVVPAGSSAGKSAAGNVMLFGAGGGTSQEKPTTQAGTIVGGAGSLQTPAVGTSGAPSTGGLPTVATAGFSSSLPVTFGTTTGGTGTAGSTSLGQTATGPTTAAAGLTATQPHQRPAQGEISKPPAILFGGGQLGGGKSELGGTHGISSVPEAPKPAGQPAAATGFSFGDASKSTATPSKPALTGPSTFTFGNATQGPTAVSSTKTDQVGSLASSAAKTADAAGGSVHMAPTTTFTFGGGATSTIAQPNIPPGSGAQAQPARPTFGVGQPSFCTATQAPTAGQSAFGSTAPAPAAGQPALGAAANAPATSQPVFGANGTGQGANQPAVATSVPAPAASQSAFGVTSSSQAAGQSTFGVPVQPPAAGQTSYDTVQGSTPAVAAFGTTLQASAASKTSFGATTQPPAAGQPSFGAVTQAPTSSQPTFGVTTQAPAVSQPTFGATTQLPTPSRPAFGATTQASAASLPVFGATAPAPAAGQSAFGTTTQPSAPTVSAFGAALTVPSVGQSVFAANAKPPASSQPGFGTGGTSGGFTGFGVAGQQQQPGNQGAVASAAPAPSGIFAFGSAREPASTANSSGPTMFGNQTTAAAPMVPAQGLEFGATQQTQGAPPTFAFGGGNTASASPFNFNAGTQQTAGFGAGQAGPTPGFATNSLPGVSFTFGAVGAQTGSIHPQSPATGAGGRKLARPARRLPRR